MNNRHRLEYAMLRSVIFFLSLFPTQFLLLFCRGVGYLVWILFPFRLAIGYKNLSIIFPQKTHSEKIRLLARTYQEVCKALGTTSILHRQSLVKNLKNAQITGLEKVKNALKQQKGIVLTSYHGIWIEAFFAWCNMSSLPITLIYQKQANPLANDFFIRKRLRFGTNLEQISTEEGMKTYQQALNNGRMLIVNLDQSYAPYGTPVVFYDQTLACPKGAAVLHLRTGAPVFTCVYYMKNNTFNIDFEEVKLKEYTKIDEDSINEITTRIIQSYESVIRCYPEQWFSLFHRLWSKKNEDYPKVYRNIRDIFL